MEKVRIGVNGRFFVQEYTGIGRYCLNIFPELAAHFPEFDFHIAIPYQMDEEVEKTLRYIDNLKFEIVPENPVLKRINAGLSKSYWERFQLTDFFISKEVKLIHLPYPALYQANIAPVIVTAHDTIAWTDPDYMRRNWLSWLYNRRTLALAREAAQVITVSKYSKGELLALGDFDSKKLKVVYNASEFADKPEFSAGEEEEILAKFGLNDGRPYLFYMGGYDKRKNVRRLLEIFAGQIEGKAREKLVLGGGKVLKTSLFIDFESELAEDENIIQTGFLTNQELLVLYRHARAYISLTTREGFNLPLLESLTLGTPAIVSDLEVHREIAGDTPIFVNLKESNELIGREILNLLNSEKMYNEIKKTTLLSAKSLSDKFSWEKSSRQIGDIYHNIINHGV